MFKFVLYGRLFSYISLVVYRHVPTINNNNIIIVMTMVMLMPMRMMIMTINEADEYDEDD